jgi:hypothetical protein
LGPEKAAEGPVFYDKKNNNGVPVKKETAENILHPVLLRDRISFILSK